MALKTGLFDVLEGLEQQKEGGSFCRPKWPFSGLRTPARHGPDPGRGLQVEAGWTLMGQGHGLEGVELGQELVDAGLGRQPGGAGTGHTV